MEVSGQKQDSPRTGRSRTGLLCPGNDWPKQGQKNRDRSKPGKRRTGSLGHVMITIFSAMWWLHHPFLYLLGRWFPAWHRKFRIRKKWPHAPYEVLKLQWGTKKSNFDSFNNWSYRLQMTRGFQIWSQNLNRTTFDPLFGPEMAENGQNPVFDYFVPFLGQKRIKCCPN